MLHSSVISLPPTCKVSPSEPSEVFGKTSSLRNWLYSRYRATILPPFFVFILAFFICFSITVGLVVMSGSRSMGSDTEAAVTVITDQCSQTISSYFQLLRTHVKLQALQWTRALETPRVNSIQLVVLNITLDASC